MFKGRKRIFTEEPFEEEYSDIEFLIEIKCRGNMDIGCNVNSDK